MFVDTVQMAFLGAQVTDVAFQLSRRPADSRRTYGCGRFQIVAAFIKGFALFLVAVSIF